MKKKLTAILLCVMMLAASVPTGVVYADEEELNEQIEQIEEQAPEIPDETEEFTDEQIPGEYEVELEVTETIPEEAEGILVELEEIPEEQGEPLEGTPAPVDFDVVSAYEYAMTLGEEEIEAYVAALTPEQYDALVAYAMEAAGDSLGSGEIEYGETVYGEIALADETVNFTNAAPLVKEQPKKKLMKAPAKAPAKDAAAPKDVDGLETSKTVTVNEDSTYTITLESYTTGSVSTQTSAVPTDIVLVLDQSGSMDDTYKTITSEGYTAYRTDNKDNVTVNHTRNLFVKLSNGQYSRLSVDVEYDASKGLNPFHWGDGFIYTYHWIDENGNEQSAQSEGITRIAGGPPPEEIKNKVYQYTQTQNTQTRREALKNAASLFISNVQKDAANNNVDHRIAVVGFASSGTNYNDDRWENTELLSTNDVINYDEIDNADYADALVSANENGSVNNRLTTAINRLDANGGTWINYGLTMAQGVFNNTDGTGRNRVVVILTDGVPGNGQWSNSSVLNHSSAGPAITMADSLKNDKGVTIYTVGIFDGADATSAGSNTGSATEKSNYFMQKLSSNNGTPPTSSDEPSYYMSADSPEALNNIFQSISEQINTPTLSLGSSTVVRDVVTEYFEIPDDAMVSLYTAECNGGNETDGYTFKGRTPYTPNDGDVTIDRENNRVDVTGFYFDANFCAKAGNTYRGKKLIIEFTVTPKDGFLGGNGVPTNELATSGVFDKDNNLVENFTLPTVDVPIPEFTIEAQDKNVYLNGTLTEDQLVEGLKIKVGDATSAVDYSEWLNGLEAWQQAFVTIPNNPSSDTTSQYTPETALTADTTYTASLTISPKIPGTVGQKQNTVTVEHTETAAINVFKPTLKFQDSKDDYGTVLTTYDYTENNYVSLDWIHVSPEELTTNADSVAMDTVKPVLNPTDGNPALVITYTPVLALTTLTEDVEVKVTVEIGGSDMTGYCTFDWQQSDACTDFGCTAKPDNAQFRIHLNTGFLKITKALADGTTIDDGQSFIFTIKGTNYAMTVVINGEGSVTISDIPSGTYTVTEDTAWSWRYVPETVTVEVGSGDPADYDSSTGATVTSGLTTEVTFTNKRSGTGTKWLSGDCYCENWFNPTAEKKVRKSA